MAGNRYTLVPKVVWAWMNPALRGIDADLTDLETVTTDGPIPTAALGTGTATPAKYLAGDGTWKTPVKSGAGITVTQAADGSYIISAGDAPLVPFASRAYGGNTIYTDVAAHAWTPRGANWNGGNFSVGLTGQEISGTTDDPLYRATVVNPPGAVIYVPAPGTYDVRILTVDDYYTAAGSRVFDVFSQGVLVADNVDVAAAVGIRAAYDITFTATTATNIITIWFVPSADVPIVCGIEVTGDVPQQPIDAPPQRAVQFTPGSYLYQNVSAAPLAANSAAIVTNLAGQIAADYDGVAQFRNNDWNVAFHVAPPGTPLVDVNYRGGGQAPPDYLQVPVPAGLTPAAGGGAEASIYDPVADKLWEFGGMQKNGSSWEAWDGGRIDNASTSEAFFTPTTGAIPSGLAAAGSMVTIAEIANGEINHAISLEVKDVSNAGPSWPAQRTNGNVTNVDRLRVGQRLRLSPSVDVDTLPGMTKLGKLVAVAAKKYGFIVTARADVVGVIAEGPGQSIATVGVNPWTLMPAPEVTSLAGFPWTQMQVLPIDYGKP